MYLLPLKSSVFVVHFSNAFWHGKEALPKHGSYTKIAPLLVILGIASIVVWMFQFYKTTLNLKTRLQERNLKKNNFFHYHLNVFICCKTKLEIKLIFYWMSLFKQNEYFYKVRFFLTKLNFLKGDTNIYFEYITLFEKKRFLLRKIKFS